MFGDFGVRPKSQTTQTKVSILKILSQLINICSFENKKLSRMRKNEEWVSNIKPFEIITTFFNTVIKLFIYIGSALQNLKP